MDTITITNYMETFQKVILSYSPKIIAAIILLILGLWLTSLIAKGFKKVMAKREVDATISNFIGNVIFWVLRFMLFIVVISKLGVETSSFVAIIGAAGLAIGLSLQGSLSNFAGGILIILFKPFKVGDFIEAQGVTGVVKEIQIFNTLLTSPDNKKIILPNAAVSNGNIINYTANGILRIDLLIGVDYNSDLKLVKALLTEILSSNEKILKDPEFSISIQQLNSNSVDFAVRPWCQADDYWIVRSNILESCKASFDANGIAIYYPYQVEKHK